MSTKFKKKSSKDILSGYPIYDPLAEGYGNADEWRETFKFRFTQTEAKEFLKADTPEAILGLSGIYTLQHAKEMFREKIFKAHPDRGGTEEEAKKIIAAWTIIKEMFGEK